MLGYKSKALSYILYSLGDDAKYSTFDIPKSCGGTRTIKAPVPKLKSLQKRLSDLLQDCIAEINNKKEIKSALSHGFRRNFSIFSNAKVHTNRRYVFNADLSDFFGSINFGRVRGFFIKNNNFKLDPKSATIIAQIACHQNSLPQGSPCSPVISNLIGHILDIRLASLAKRYGCTYSRYADDITFSTNKSSFPSKIAFKTADEEPKWEAGHTLYGIVNRSGFTINASKTRMQFEQSRQDVTGLVVNKIVNTKWEYRHHVRAMVDHLRKTGDFFIKRKLVTDDGDVEIEKAEGSSEQLGGMLSFIHSVNTQRLNKPLKKAHSLSAFEKVYRDYLFYSDFYAAPLPVILCEGKTDNIYLRAAIERLADKFPSLVHKSKKGKTTLKIRIYNYSKTTGRILSLSGGTGDLCKFIKSYNFQHKRILSGTSKVSIILLVDNDDGAHGKGGMYQAIKDVMKFAKKPDGNKNSYPIFHGLHVVPTPKLAGNKHSMIEDFFEPKLLKSKLDGKIFNMSNKNFDSKKEYGKYLFATQIVKKQKNTINFDGFIPILQRISDVVDGKP